MTKSQLPDLLASLLPLLDGIARKGAHGGNALQALLALLKIFDMVKAAKAGQLTKEQVEEQAKAFAQSLEADIKHNDELADAALAKGIADRFDRSDDGAGEG